jgi:nitroreductase
MQLLEAIRSRRSVRAFTARTVPRETIAAILDAAAWAPSGSNMQPWLVHVVTGEPLARLRRAAVAAFDSGAGGEPEWRYYPEPIPEPFLTRRRACGFGLYAHLGIARADRAARARQHARNFELFGAPVALFFLIDSRLARGSWLDYGMFLQNVMLLAREHGLHTCPQAAWLEQHRVVRSALSVGPGLTLVCGMALGYADEAAATNAYQPPREPHAVFTTWHDAAPGTAPSPDVTDYA